MSPQRLAIPLRDGTRQVADLYLPGVASAPAVLTRTPYERGLFAAEAAALADAGYAVLVQSVRGRHGSEGTFRPYFHETDDGFDSVEWIAAQDWCDGNVAMMGGSYGGWTQWAAARARPPHLRTLVSAACCASWTTEWPWRNGVRFAGAVGWLALVAGHTDQDIAGIDYTAADVAGQLRARVGEPLPMADEWLKPPCDDGYWTPITLQAEDFTAIDLPVLHLTGWFDGCLVGTHDLYLGMRHHSPRAADQRLVIGPWDHATGAAHTEHDGVDFGPEGHIGIRQLRIAWFDRWLRGGTTATGASGTPELPVTAFATGVNAWQSWPDLPHPEATPITLELGSDGVLAVDGVHGTRSWPVDPAHPVPSTDGDPAAYPGVRRSAINGRADVAVWRGSPVSRPVTLAGAPALTLHIESDIGRTDVFAQLADEGPDGVALLVAYGAAGGLETDGVTEVPVPLTPRAHVLQPGHRWVLALAGTAHPLWVGRTDQPHRVTLRHSEHASSGLTIPVLPVTDTVGV